MPRRLKRLEGLASTERKLTHTIGGQGEASEVSFEVINPSTAAPFISCPQASAAQLDKAVASS